MVRKKTFTHEQLLEKTEELLIEYGYEHFHLKLLSTHLDGARSTIYSYYKSKEEIVSACMRAIMQRVLDRTAQIEQENIVEGLRQLLYTYLQEADLHKILKDIKKIESNHSPSIIENKRFLEEGHHKLMEQLLNLFVRAQKEGLLRQDIPPVIMAVTFNALIDVPNPMRMELDLWSEILFDIWLNGAKHTSGLSKKVTHN